MIARRANDESPRPSLVVRCQQLVHHSAQLERTGELQVFELEEDLVPVFQSKRTLDRRLAYVLANAPLGTLDSFSEITHAPISRSAASIRSSPAL